MANENASYIIHVKFSQKSLGRSFSKTCRCLGKGVGGRVKWRGRGGGLYKVSLLKHQRKKHLIQCIYEIQTFDNLVSIKITELNAVRHSEKGYAI